MTDRPPGQLSRSAFLTACFALLAGCKTVGFKEVFMSTDSAGKRKTKSFPTEFTSNDSGIFCHITYSSGRDDAELKIYVTPPVENYPATLVAGDSIILGKGEGQLSIQLGILTEGADGKTKVETVGPWEVGAYKLDFYIDNAKEDSISFDVAALKPAEEPPA